MSAAAQEGCELGEGSERLQTQPDPRGGSITRLTTPYFECEGDVEIWADSAVAYQFDAMSILYGSVRYVDPQRELRADYARYFSEVGRLQAEGNVRVTNFEDGSSVENGDLVYLRQTEYRDVEEMTFTTGDDRVRPLATVYPKRPPPASVDDTAAAAPVAVAEPAEPEQYVVIGDRLFFRGDSYFTATGDDDAVQIVRDSLFAFADSAEYDGDRGELLLDGSARVESGSFDLVGRNIVLASAADGSDEVRARRDALLTGEDLRVTAEQVVLHLVDGELERMVAVPLPDEDDGSALPGPPQPADSTAAVASTTAARPLAVSEDIELTGDSLDLAAPGGVLERIFAAGRARSVSRGRTELNVESLPDLARQDWIDADTIEVMLVPADVDSIADLDPDAASGNDYEVDRIVARVRAHSLYRLVPADSAAVPGLDPPAVSYMVADQITIFMVDGQADRVESVGQVSGWHLEPLGRTATDPAGDAPPADSIGNPTSPPTSPTDAPADDLPRVTPAVGGDGPPPDAYLPSRDSNRTWRPL